MKEQQQSKKNRARLVGLGLMLVLMVGLGLGGWQVYRAQQAAAGTATATAAAAAKGYQTATVRKGSLSVSVTGSGKVITAQALDLGFSVTGTVAEMAVQVGDVVKKGQTLAALSGIDLLTLKVQQQQVALDTAQKTLAELQAGGSSALAEAQVNQAKAAAALAQAQANLRQAGVGRCEASRTEQYYEQVQQAQASVDEWQGYLQGGTGYSTLYIQQRLIPMRKTLEQASANYTYCQGYTAQEIQDSQVALQVAQANLRQADRTYADLKQTQGIDTQALAIAQAAVKSAELGLAAAQADLAGATIIAPMDGTVTAVKVGVGDAAGTGPILSLADLTQPAVQVTVDESDLVNFATGCPAQVTFTNLTGQTFAGKVTRVEPALVTVQNVSMVQGLVDLDHKQTAAGKILPLGLTASVEVTCQQAQDVVLVAAQAVHQPAGQPAYVYILNAQGRPEKRPVEVGIKTVAQAEIRSGLTAGERVITSPVTGQ